MFSKAYNIAKDFTRPFIISLRRHDGKCNSGIGTYVIINEDGWFVTAFHIIKQIMELNKSVFDYSELLKQRIEIEKDNTKNPSVKKGILRKLVLPNEAITNFSLCLGTENEKISPIIHMLPDVDLAIGQIINFNKNSVKAYPKFKDYSKQMDIGTSLCKLGFPFHSFVPTFDENNQSFKLPEGAFPMPLFPIEGIYTRTVKINSNNNNLKIPLMYIETSSPGLRGQSGGPTFDIDGNIWALQSQTQSYKLGFGEKTNGLTNKEAEHLQNQFLNVGWGTHSQTIIEFLKHNKISFQLSDN